MFQRLFAKSVPQQRLDGAVDHLSDQEAQEALRTRSAAMMQRLERKSREARRIAAEEQEARIKAITTPPIADDGVEREAQSPVAEPDNEIEAPEATAPHNSATDNGADANGAADAGPEPAQDRADDLVNPEQNTSGQRADVNVEAGAADPDEDELRRTAEEARARIAARLQAREESDGAEPPKNDDRLDLGHNIPPLVNEGEPVEGD